VIATPCPSCGRENPEDARFCAACGAELAPAAAPAEERKVVSVLFVDLVGFTASSEAADPEDVRARLRDYHVRAKQEVERFGGSVEKFVGDAVMAVFGAPVAHEDDAERAVRAALNVLDAVAELGLQVRAAVNTGEALVTLGARPAEGEAMVAGDVVNTASRLQGAAPAGAVVVGELTYRATTSSIDYEPLDPVTLKGKAEPVRVWRATGARSRFGIDLEPARATPFLGRDHELAVLKDTFQRAERENAVQLVTVTGEPGVGKSRLVGEFRAWLDDRTELVRWRQGRCLPYGEGITFWALGEIVKAHGGILESDPPARAVEKLREALPEAQDREWLVTRLAPLVGAESVQIPRAESFTAWRRFLEDVASERPLVAVVEDLHWADPSLIEFLEHLVDWGSEVPLLVLCSARPELYERFAGWGGGKRNSATISLSPLSADDTTRLVGSLLDQAVLPAETQAALLERGGGNPLFTVEFVRMLVDRGILDSRARIGTESIAVPDSVQALIAARLDTLAPERKSLLHDAAVLGKVFWAGAVAAMGDRTRDDVDAGLRELVRKELIRPARLSSVEGDVEFSFWHASIREVAYGQLPRDARARKHAAAARWIESIAPDNFGLIAHHWDEAFKLAEAAGAHNVAADYKPAAQRFHFQAGERVLQIDRDAGERHFTRARALAEPGTSEAAWAGLRETVARWLSARDPRTGTELHGILEEFTRLDDIAGRGATLSFQATLAWNASDDVEARRLNAESLAIHEQLPPSVELLRTRTFGAFYATNAGDPAAGLAQAEQALALANELGSVDFSAALALQVRGQSRLMLGDPDAIEDMREAVRLFQERGGQTYIAFINLAFSLWVLEGPLAALEVQHQASEEARAGGVDDAHIYSEETWTQYELGDWDEIGRLTARVAELEHGSRRQAGLNAETMQAHVASWRGDVAGATAAVADLLPLARRSPLQAYIPTLTTAIQIAHARGDLAEAVALARELADVQDARSYVHYGFGHPDAVRACVAAGELELAKQLVAGMHLTTPHERNADVACRALLAEARGEIDAALELYADAAARFRDWPFPLERALALLGAERCGGDAEDALEILARLGVSEPQLAARSAP
jgi:class 3 adenylate cyclase